MSKLAEFYTGLLDLCGIEVGNLGRLTYRSSTTDGAEQLSIVLQYDGKPIIFPEKQHLENPENRNDEVIVLHPLSESSLRAPSEVQEVLRKAAIVRICEVGDFLLKRAIKINHDASMDKSIKLNHKLSKLFHSLGDEGDVDVKFVNWFNKIDTAMQQNPSYRLFNIFLRMHGEVGKNKYDRVAVISSPLYDELKLAKDSTTVFGVEGGRKKDIATLLRFLEALFPELANGGYISGSSSGTAPTLMAFMEAMALIAGRFNKLLTEYGKEAKGIEGGTTRGVDFDRNVKLSALRSAHPLEDFNIGVGKDSDDNRPKNVERPREAKVEAPKVATPRDLEVPVRSSTATTRSEPKVEKEDADAGIPDNAFWLGDDRDSRDRDRRDRDDRYSRDDRDRRDYRDDRRDSRDRYSRDSRDDRDYRDDRREPRSRTEFRRRDDRDYRDDRRDSRRDYRDDRRGRDDGRTQFGQFWENAR